MGSRAWKLYSATMAVVIGAFFLCPDTGLLPVVWQVGIGWSAAAAVVAGVRLHRPQAALAWYLFAAGVFLNSSGIGVEAYLNRGGRDLTPPSIVDFLYLSIYPAVVAGLIVLILRRKAGRERATLVDAATISTGLGLLVWVFVIRPSLGDPLLSPIGQLVVVAYPIGDIVVLAMIVRLLIGSGGRGFAYRTLAATVLMFLGGDMSWAAINQIGLEPGPHTGKLLSMLFLTGYVLFAVAALHPSVRDVAEQGTVRKSRLSPVTLIVLTAVSLIAPSLLIIEVARHEVEDGIAIAIGSVILFLLVITRMAQLLREVERQTQRLRELTQVDELTGLPNRRAWSFELPRAVERARRSGAALSVAMLDLDHFKKFNDEYGHPAGDRLLKSAGAVWLAEIRTGDLLARYGGEEFILLLSDAQGPTALDVLDRLRAATPLGQTFSAGLARWDGAETSDELIARADSALYRAKDEGRNRTTTANATDADPDRGLSSYLASS
jgi:diguanylate cyclase